MTDIEKRIEVGSHVTHKLTGQGMTVKRISDTVATCVKDIPEPWTSMGVVYPGDTAICLLENLILDKAQQALTSEELTTQPTAQAQKQELPPPSWPEQPF